MKLTWILIETAMSRLVYYSADKVNQLEHMEATKTNADIVRRLVVSKVKFVSKSSILSGYMGMFIWLRKQETTSAHQWT